MSVPKLLGGAIAVLAVVSACSGGGATPAGSPAATIAPPPAPASAGPGGSLALPSIAIPSVALPSVPTGGEKGTPLPCDKLAPLVTQITTLPIAAIEASNDDCSFTVNPPGDSSTSGFGGIVDIRRESSDAADYDQIATLFTGTDGVDVPGIGDRARRTKSGTLIYAVHGGQMYAVQQELLVSGLDVPGNAVKLLQALFSLV